MAPKAHKVGSLLFCPTCGTLLDLPRVEDFIQCEQCGHEEPASSYENTVVATRSHPDAFPSALKLKRTTQTLIHEGADLGTLTEEACPKCGHGSSWYKTAQTRSADEGATVSYICADDSCKHRWKLNN